MMHRNRTWMLGILMCSACGTFDFEEWEDWSTTSSSEGPPSGGFSATYEDCDEFAGVGLVPIAALLERVPSDYTVVEGAPGLGVVVAQAASCARIMVDTGPERAGFFAQFGVSVIPPDGRAGGHFYQLMFTSDHPTLVARLKRSGANTQLSPDMTYSIGGTPIALHVLAPRPEAWAFELDGPITLPDPNSPPNPESIFNYWHQSPRFGNVVQSNVVTGIRLGTGAGVVLTALGEDMEAIVGPAPLSFPFFSSPETFDVAALTVTTDAF